MRDTKSGYNISIHNSVVGTGSSSAYIFTDKSGNILESYNDEEYTEYLNNKRVKSTIKKLTTDYEISDETLDEIYEYFSGGNTSITITGVNIEIVDDTSGYYKMDIDYYSTLCSTTPTKSGMTIYFSQSWEILKQENNGIAGYK